MIVKHIERKVPAKFNRLTRDLLDVKADEAVLWKQAEEFEADPGIAGRKVAWWRLTNCVSEVPAWAIKEIEATQARNMRARVDKTYHVAVSFPEGEAPTREQLEDIEDTICAGLDFGGRQRMSVLHTDTVHLHLHIIINKVHPGHFRLNDLCRELERRHGLRRTNRDRR